MWFVCKTAIKLVSFGSSFYIYIVVYKSIKAWKSLKRISRFDWSHLIWFDLISICACVRRISLLLQQKKTRSNNYTQKLILFKIKWLKYYKSALKKSIAIKTNIKKRSVDKCRGFVRSLIVEPIANSILIGLSLLKAIVFSMAAQWTTLQGTSHTLIGVYCYTGASNTISNSFF